MRFQNATYTPKTYHVSHIWKEQSENAILCRPEEASEEMNPIMRVCGCARHTCKLGSFDNDMTSVVSRVMQSGLSFTFRPVITSATAHVVYGNEAMQRNELLTA
jgi:hypothetical protein